MKYLIAILFFGLSALADVQFPTSKVLQVRNVYSSVNVTTGAYVQLVASLAATATSIEVFDSSGQTLQIAVGASGSEVVQFQVIPGGNGLFPLRIPKGSRIAIKAISGTANAGEIDLNIYSDFYR